VKRNTVHESTTGAPATQKAMASRAWPLGLGLLSSAITLPVSVHFVGHASGPLAVGVGLIPALPATLVVVTSATIYLLAEVVAIVVTVGRVMRHNFTAAECIDDMFIWIVNPLISLLSLQPYKPPRRKTKSTARASNPLPAVPGAARRADEPFFWRTMQSQAERPGGARTDVPLPGDPVITPTAHVRGRHARPDQETDAKLRSDDARTAKAATIGSAHG
jgi:hypothetical protein